MSDLHPEEFACSEESARLIREFVDLWGQELSTNEDNSDYCVELTDLIEDLRNKWHAAEVKAAEREDMVAELRRTVDMYEEELSIKNEKLTQLQSELRAVAVRHDNCVREILEYKKRFYDVRELIKDQSAFNAEAIEQMVSELPSDGRSSGFSDIDYDDAVFERAPLPCNPSIKKRRSQSYIDLRDKQSSVQASKLMECIEESVHSEAKPAPALVRPSVRRSNSDASIDPTRSSRRTNNADAFAPQTSSPFIPNTQFSSPLTMQPSWTRGEAIEKRTHRVVSMLAIWECCDVCHKRFNLKAKSLMKCLDCNIYFHRSCHTKVPLPCLPKITLPKRLTDPKPMLSALCPKTHPMIPACLIYCVVAIERNRLDTEGIYRIPGLVSKVQKLMRDIIYNRVPPSLDSVEVEVICSTVKCFFRTIRDTLVPASSFDTFFRGVLRRDDDAVVAAYLDLPSPHRDTLSYFILHLQKVASHAMNNRMSLLSLAVIFGPTLIGVSPLTSIRSKKDRLRQEQILNDIKKVILLYFLDMPKEFFERFISHNMSAVIQKNSRFPGRHAKLLLPVPRTVPRQYMYCENEVSDCDPLSLDILFPSLSDNLPATKPLPQNASLLPGDNLSTLPTTSTANPMNVTRRSRRAQLYFDPLGN